MSIPRDDPIEESIASAKDRYQLWTSVINKRAVKAMAEIGVWRGDFAETILRNCHSIDRYIMIDPWRPLPNWNKPANVTKEQFDDNFRHASRRTQFAENRRLVMRGTTTEVIELIQDFSLDFVYIDGDHTLRGIIVDLISIFPKIRSGGIIGGDDFCQTIFEHNIRFEPTLVFPVAVHAAEGFGARIFGLPHNQFMIEKPSVPKRQFEFIDLTDRYQDLSLKSQIDQRPNAFIDLLRRFVRVSPFRTGTPRYK